MQLERVVIGNDEEKFVQVGVQLPPQEKQELIDFHIKNIDVFARSIYKAPGMDSDFVCHLPSFKFQSLCHPQEATTLVLI